MQKIIDALIQPISLATLKAAHEELSSRYRNHEKPYLTRKEHYLAYLMTRFPATFAAITHVFKALPDYSIESMLDLGAGPGTGYLAAQQVFPMLSKGTLLETDPEFIALGKKLIDTPVQWQQAHLPCALTPHDLVLLSYSLGEMLEPEKIVTQAFLASKKLLVLIEPGTPKGYAQIINMRTHLLAQGAYMIAPCPNALPCPMQETNWCHFPVRVARSKMHRQLKGGELGYEDEKFSYLVVSKEPHPLPQARIVDKPEFHTGWVSQTLCHDGKIEKKIIAKKDKAFYKKCRKLSWGDEL